MSEEIYSGETSTIVLRCRNQAGDPVDMAGKRADVLMTDHRGRILFRFSTDDPDSKPVDVKGHYLLCPLSSDEMAQLRGLYLVEIRIASDSTVSVAQVPGVRVLDSITRKLFTHESTT